MKLTIWNFARTIIINESRRSKYVWIKISISELRDSQFKSYVLSKFNHLGQLTNLDTISNQTYMTTNLIINRKYNTHEIE